METAFNPITDNEYLGGNSLFLNHVAEKYDNNKSFAGYRQWKEIGRSVKKGEKGHKILVIFKDKKGDTKPTSRTVFNFMQTEKIEK